ncbi:MAG TPA: hypothetical protein VFV92_15220, partial [Candidatus Bathyarchaeia archaeon]|nr:hypothetical protein [Candidatus Bathyarchaeia archaeon]
GYLLQDPGNYLVTREFRPLQFANPSLSEIILIVKITRSGEFSLTTFYVTIQPAQPVTSLERQLSRRRLQVKSKILSWISPYSELF